MTPSSQIISFLLRFPLLLPPFTLFTLSINEITIMVFHNSKLSAATTAAALVATSAGWWTAPSLGVVESAAAAKPASIHDNDEEKDTVDAMANASSNNDPTNQSKTATPQPLLTNDDGILKNNTNEKEPEPVPSVLDEWSSSSSLFSASSFTTEDEIQDEKLVGRILSRKTAKKKNSHNNNQNGMMDGSSSSSVVEGCWYEGTQCIPWFTCHYCCKSYAALDGDLDLGFSSDYGETYYACVGSA